MLMALTIKFNLLESNQFNKDLIHCYIKEVREDYANDDRHI